MQAGRRVRKRKGMMESMRLKERVGVKGSYTGAGSSHSMRGRNSAIDRAEKTSAMEGFLAARQNADDGFELSPDGLQVRKLGRGSTLTRMLDGQSGAIRDGDVVDDEGRAKCLV